ncbi:XRE family transcriptional regulator [Ralstonia sp. CHL-2022]|uniref:XRE family transcriptional regulator n=1 Tax=Ralstonia mojiangensis TaxID=2953895 RepID=A0AAE3I4B3_9RALS|nr:XRE family transcriptional regulator [Ralstonia mojiangensis]MCT7317413.1 XRE family transcriptional regulator [Ralstonia mojiangensis]
MDTELKIRPEILGSRLKAARLEAGRSQGDVADALGVARTTIVAIEGGKRKVSAKELRAFAELLGASEAELLATSAQSLDMGLKFRSTIAASTDPAKAAATTLLNRLAASAIELEKLLSHPVPQAEYPPIVLAKHQPLEQQAEDAALALRQRLGIGLGPILDVTSLLEMDLGVRLFERRLPSSISGACAYDREVGGFILVNSEHRPERRRLTAVHELCHALLRRTGVFVHAEGEELGEREEKFCDAFARAFLMPASTVRRKAAELMELAGRFSVRELLAMSIYFDASMEAMTRRMEALTLLPKGTFDSLRDKGLTLEHLQRVKTELGKSEEKASFTPRTLILAASAYEQNLLSEQQIAHKLDMDLLEVREAFEALVGERSDLLELAL